MAGPEIIIVAGPNGAGKTTFANQYVEGYGSHLVFVNADEIARDIGGLGLSEVERNVRAGRIMLGQIDELVAAKRAFMFETTLASLSYARKIPIWRKAGFKVLLTYVRLEDVEVSLARVAKRVASGGHDIPKEAILRRFGKSLEYLEKYYKPVVDEWYIYDSSEESSLVLAESWRD